MIDAIGAAVVFVGTWIGAVAGSDTVETGIWEFAGFVGTWIVVVSVGNYVLVRIYIPPTDFPEYCHGRIACDQFN